MQLTTSPPVLSVQDWDDEFLALWPHRYDYLWAEHPHPNERPDWKTESRYPLSDRLIQQGAYLYGVRFGQTTQYAVIDIDMGSIYHPTRDRWAWKRIMATLEPLGLVEAVLCTSSYSGGIHLYLPFTVGQKTWAIALAITTLLENAGFKLAPGQLEVFPNRKPYSISGEPSLYNGHRLPLQAGSYLLNQELQMIWSDQHTFVQHWQFAQQRNCIQAKLVNRIIKAARREEYRITRRAEKFLNDLNAEIERGWTGHGQTNRLLGRITLRSYIFGHILNADSPLEGDDLVADVITIAKALPGYEDWCRHQHEIEKRAQDWVAAIERSHYFHYGTKKSTTESQQTTQNPVEESWNEHQSKGARERIQRGVTDLLGKGALPAGVKQRVKVLARYGVSGQTLYKYRELWHPHELATAENRELQSGIWQGSQIKAPCQDSPPSLLVKNGCNPNTGRHFSQSKGSVHHPIGCNLSSEARLEGFQAFQIEQQQRQQAKRMVAQQKQVERMQRYLASGDPILMAEAIAWYHQNPNQQ